MGSAAAALMATLSSVHIQFKKLKLTASESCNAESPASACWEDSEVYSWEDLVSALSTMATTGIAGMTFYAGDGGADSEMYGLANLAAFLSQTMQETIQYDACDENNWSNEATVSQHGSGTVYSAASACGQLGQSYQDYKCTDITDPETGETIRAEDMQCEVDPNMQMVAQTHASWSLASGSKAPSSASSSTSP